ncbi:MAG: type II toxin-antitoxin system VapC family toxin [Deltaproteobacteria bacterium]|nr:type II toxin-antitoxin system VapC family toxin [Deltaproteobacteria bacterium]
MGFLIDTCIWIEVERGAVAPADVAAFTGQEPVFLSPVTLAELTFGVEMAGDPKIRLKRMAALGRLRKKPLLVIDEATGILFGRLAAQLKRSGKDHQYRVQDLWLASQAMQHGFKLLTQNEKDFFDIPGLDMILYPKPPVASGPSERG